MYVFIYEYMKANTAIRYYGDYLFNIYAISFSKMRLVYTKYNGLVNIYVNMGLSYYR